MKISRLSERQNLYKDTIKLIEESLNYSRNNSYEIDFAPLVDKENLDNCFILHDNNKVVGHIGLLKKTFNYNDNKFDSYFIGGICIHDSIRGQGHFSSFFNEVVKQYKDAVPFLLLWSDLNELYQKFDFFEFGSIIQTGTKTNLEDHQDIIAINPNDVKEDLKRLYRNLTLHNLIFVERTDREWNKILKISSANYYVIKEHEQISSYFVQNKGADLKGIIHESIFPFKEKSFSSIEDYSLWLPPSLTTKKENELYTGFIKIGNEELFSGFIKIISNTDIVINSIHDEVDFNYKNQNHVLNKRNFLQGVFGPGKIEEFNHLPDFYISGLDSI